MEFEASVEIWYLLDKFVEFAAEQGLDLGLMAEEMDDEGHLEAAKFMMANYGWNGKRK